MDTPFAFLGLDPVHAWAEVVPLLPPDFRALATTHRQVLTQYGNAKITSAEELLRFVFAYAGTNMPLRDVVSAIEATGGPRISAMRLHMKLRQSSAYLHALLQSAVPERLELLPDLTRGLELVQVGSTKVVGPSSTQAPERLHAATVLHDARVDATAITDPSEYDGLRSFFWSPKQVAVATDGAATAASAGRVAAQGAFVLLEMCDGQLPLADAHGGGIDVRAFTAGLRSEGKDAVLERPARILLEGKKRLEGRLFTFARKDPRGQHSGVKLQRRDDLTAFFTSIPSATYAARELADLVERAAPVGEKLGGWTRPGARLSNQLEDTTRAWVYARALLGVLEQKVARAA